MMDRRDFVKYLGLAGAGAALLKVNPVLGAPKMQGQSHKMKTLNILFDSWSSQVMYQQSPGRYPVGFMHPEPTGRRLNTILGAMKSYGFSTGYEWNVSFTHSRVTAKELAGMDVYVSLTRYINMLNPPPPVTGTGFSYDDSDLTALEAFVTQGGGILLMTDHGENSPAVPNWTANDAALASLFGVTLEDYFVTYVPPNGRGYMVMEMNPNLSGDLLYLSYQVQGISAHDSCIINPPPVFTPLVTFPSGSTAFNYATKTTIDFKDFPSHGLSQYYSILVPYGAGQVIVVGNSGMVGDYGFPSPAPGIVNLEKNLMFFLNCVSYLGGLTCIPIPGQGPCYLYPFP